MATKKVHIDGIGEVSLYKRRGTSSVRISLTASGVVRVTMPSWAPFKVGIEYARSKQTWIQTHKTAPSHIQDGASIGKAHHLYFEHTDRSEVRTRIRQNAIYVSVPTGMDVTDASVQSAAQRASLRAIRYEAKTLLPQRLRHLAAQHGFSVRSIAIRQLKGRWGSCSQDKDIVLNLYLMQLPWELIDYVIVHELVHTRIMAHGRPFWDEVAKYVPHLPLIRKQMRQHQPVV